MRVILTDEAENITQQSWDYLRLHRAMAILCTYVVFNPRFETDPTWQEFVVRADENTLTLLLTGEIIRGFLILLNDKGSAVC